MRNACDSDSRCGLACDASARNAKSLAMRVERCEPLRSERRRVLTWIRDLASKKSQCFAETSFVVSLNWVGVAGTFVVFYFTQYLYTFSRIVNSRFLGSFST